MKIDEAAIVLVDMKLRGDFADVIGNIGSGARSCIEAHATADAEASKMSTLPPEAVSLLSCVDNAAFATLLKSSSFPRAAALLLEVIAKTQLFNPTTIFSDDLQ